MKIQEYDILPSSQTFVKENIDNVLDTYIVAKEQINGRGRTGHTWLSSKENLMFSFAVKCDKLLIENYPLLTLLTGLAIRDTLSNITNDDNFLIKWPNDIVYNGKKVCGIIAEGLFKEEGNYIVIGIGVNVNQINFDESISKTATSLKNITNKEFENREILNRFDIVFHNLLAQLENNDKTFIQKIDKYNYLKNKQVNINNDKFINQTFECIRISNNGCLVLKDLNNKEFEINSNEVTLHNNY